MSMMGHTAARVILRMAKDSLQISDALCADAHANRALMNVATSQSRQIR